MHRVAAGMEWHHDPLLDEPRSWATTSAARQQQGIVVTEMSMGTVME